MCKPSSSYTETVLNENVFQECKPFEINVKTRKESYVKTF